MSDLCNKTIEVISPSLLIDARGLACPLPLLKAKQGLNQLAVGECLQLLATDPGSERDIHAYMSLSAHHLESFSIDAGTYIYLIRKG